MDYAVSRARLKNYFSTVTYIDDRFDHCIIDEPLDFGDEETVDTPPLPILGLATPPIATGEISVQERHFRFGAIFPQNCLQTHSYLEKFAISPPHRGLYLDLGLDVYIYP